ncbi:MAG: MFS transporter, partial [Alphaproteobacteria bacterium]|nr:MFS transporter [Alphaproteobacteria bacterium]
RTVMAIVGPVLAVELGLSGVELGTLAACMFAAYAVAQLPLGVALDAFGARRVQTALMALAANMQAASVPSSTPDRPSSTASTGPTIAITVRAAWFTKCAAASGNVTLNNIGKQYDRH